MFYIIFREVYSPIRQQSKLPSEFLILSNIGSGEGFLTLIGLLYHIIDCPDLFLFLLQKIFHIINLILHARRSALACSLFNTSSEIYGSVYILIE